jgi:hypothetical protein
MLTFFTVLYIYANGAPIYALPFPSHATCSQALLQLEELSAKCQETNLITRSPRPQARPWSDT